MHFSIKNNLTADIASLFFELICRSVVNAMIKVWSLGGYIYIKVVTFLSCRPKILTLELRKLKSNIAISFLDWKFPSTVKPSKKV